MRIAPEIDSVSIVMVGDLNPRIFRPEWFATQNLLAPKVAEAAEIEIIHPDLTKFTLDWLAIQVEKRRFVATTNSVPHIRLADLVARTFGELLIHTPIHMLGINRSVHFSAGSLAGRDAIGKTLAPQDAWGEWGPMIEGTLDRHGGMRSLTMEQTNLDDREKGHIQARVGPSAVLPKGKYGVSVDINDHYVLSSAEDAAGCEKAVMIIQTGFEASLKRSAWIIDQVMALGNRG